MISELIGLMIKGILLILVIGVIVVLLVNSNFLNSKEILIDMIINLTTGLESNSECNGESCIMNVDVEECNQNGTNVSCSFNELK